jgi:hypothetical protein
VKQISIPVTNLTARQMASLAAKWGLPEQRYNTAVIERAVTTIYMLEIGAEHYRQRLAEIEQGIPDPPGWAEQIAALQSDSRG